MEHHKVWKKIKRADMPQVRCCVKHKWVFKIKRNGVFCARLGACGCSQIPGVDYTKNYAPIINNVTYMIMLVYKIIWKLALKIMDLDISTWASGQGYLHGLS
jgi:hypothetical protein